MNKKHAKKLVLEGLIDCIKYELSTRTEGNDGWFTVGEHNLNDKNIERLKLEAAKMQSVLEKQLERLEKSITRDKERKEENE